MNTPSKKVYVGMSGGVDSSVAATLLKDQGYDVTGIFIKIWHPTISNCDWKSEMRDAMRVCAHLEIPFDTIDLSDLYFERVIGYMLESYAKNQTPNPDVMCNDIIKFGAFYDWAIGQGADHVATGHYARISQKNNDFFLEKGKDAQKDQSYFLWRIKKDQLAHILFPIGSHKKGAVRALAEKNNLPNAAKKDSQGLCFIGDVDVKAFLKKHITTTPGDVLNESGKVIGVHDGVELYTLGERHGFTITSDTPDRKPHYVTAKDIATNTLTVSTQPPVQNAATTTVPLADFNLLASPKDSNVQAVIRYHGKSHMCAVSHDDQAATLTFHEAAPYVATGQSVVLYQGDVCVGGGVAV